METHPGLFYQILQIDAFLKSKIGCLSNHLCFDGYLLYVTYPPFEWVQSCCCQEHRLAFTIADEDSGLKWSQSQVAKKLTPPLHWNTAATSIGWQMKWSLNGMTPQRPVVLVSNQIDLDTDKVFVLKSAA